MAIEGVPPAKGDDTNQPNQAKTESDLAYARLHDDVHQGRMMKVSDNVVIGANGMPATADPTANMVADRVAQHMHKPGAAGEANTQMVQQAMENRTHTVATGADREAGLFGPETDANKPKYDQLKQDFDTVDSQFKAELAQQQIQNPQAQQMRQFLYSMANDNQRQQFLNAYKLQEPPALKAFNQKYGNKAVIALQWAMEH